MRIINKTEIRSIWFITFKNNGKGLSIKRMEGVFYCNGWVIGIVCVL